MLYSWGCHGLFVRCESVAGSFPAVDKIKSLGVPAGIAGHNPEVFKWAEDNLDVDFYMCSYYNSAHRDEQAEHLPDSPEWFKPEDRNIMTSLIQHLSKPVIFYSVRVIVVEKGFRRSIKGHVPHLKQQAAGYQ